MKPSCQFFDGKIKASTTKGPEYELANFNDASKSEFQVCRKEFLAAEFRSGRGFRGCGVRALRLGLLHANTGSRALPSRGFGESADDSGHDNRKGMDEVRVIGQRIDKFRV